MYPKVDIEILCLSSRGQLDKGVFQSYQRMKMKGSRLPVIAPKMADGRPFHNLRLNLINNVVEPVVT